MIDIFKYAKLQGKKISVTCTDKEKVTGVWTDYIYEDEETNQIITTYEKKSAAIGFEENVITINRI